MSPALSTDLLLLCVTRLGLLSCAQDVLRVFCPQKNLKKGFQRPTFFFKSFFVLGRRVPRREHGDSDPRLSTFHMLQLLLELAW